METWQPCGSDQKLYLELYNYAYITGKQIVHLQSDVWDLSVNRRK